MKWKLLVVLKAAACTKEIEPKTVFAPKVSILALAVGALFFFWTGLSLDDLMEIFIPEW